MRRYVQILGTTENQWKGTSNFEYQLYQSHLSRDILDLIALNNINKIGTRTLTACSKTTFLEETMNFLKKCSKLTTRSASGEP